MTSLTHPRPDRHSPEQRSPEPDLREVIEVVIGVDTHTATHTAAVVCTRTGGVLGEITIDATPLGYQQLVEFAEQHPALRAWAIEGTSSHGAGLARLLSATGEVIIELDRPERARRRHGAKSDALDAVRAAREALARPRWGSPRVSHAPGAAAHAGERDALATLLVARRSAVQAAGDARRQLNALIVTAPDHVRDRFHATASCKAPAIAARLRHRIDEDVATATTITVMRSLARRIDALEEEAAAHQAAIVVIVRGWRPDLLAVHGVGPIVAATVLCAWSHPGRVHSDAAFAMLAGIAPIPANSGQQQTRWRLNRSGDRRLNQAVHTIVLCRTRHDPRTRDYIAKRTAEGKTPREIRRCLKRYVIRELYRLLEQPAPTT